MYILYYLSQFHDYEEALALAKRSKFTLADVEEMGHKYFKILLDSGQDERAALLKVRFLNDMSHSNSPRCSHSCE